MLQIGDKVRCLDDSGSGGLLEKGKTYIVDRLCGYGPYVAFDHSGLAQFHISRFEKVNDNNKFQKGDKVRCVEDGYARDYLKIGEMYTIESIYTIESSYKDVVRLVGVSQHMPFWASRFEKVEVEPENNCPKYPNDISKFHLGRVVKFHNPSGDDNIGHVIGFGVNSANEVIIEIKLAKPQYNKNTTTVHPEYLVTL